MCALRNVRIPVLRLRLLMLTLNAAALVNTVFKVIFQDFVCSDLLKCIDLNGKAD